MLYKLQLKEKINICLAFPVIVSEDNQSALVDEGKLLYRRISFRRQMWREGSNVSLLPSLMKSFLGQLSSVGETTGGKWMGNLTMRASVCHSLTSLNNLGITKTETPRHRGPPNGRQHKASCNIYGVFSPKSLT